MSADTSVGGGQYGDTDTEFTDDELRRASIPKLGDLMKDAVDRGLITPVKSYSELAEKYAQQVRNNSPMP